MTLGCQHVAVVLPIVDQCHTSYCDPIRGVITAEIKCRGDSCSCDPESGCKCGSNCKYFFIIIIDYVIIFPKNNHKNTK